VQGVKLEAPTAVPRPLAAMDSVVALIQQAVHAEDVVQICREAAREVLAIYNADPASWEVQTKSDDSPLTKADQVANAVIVKGLKRIAPHIPIVSEENKAIPYAVRKHYAYCWCVDPIDGTKEFIKRNGQFTVNVALLRGAAPVLGVVHQPVGDVTYWGVLGKGAYERTGEGPDAPIKCASFSMEDEGLSLVGSASHSSPQTAEFIAKFKNPTKTSMGSSLKFMLVATGKAHCYPRLAPTCEWDTAASQIIVEEAGGVVIQAGKCSSKGEILEDMETVLKTETPVVYNKEDPLNPFFVAYGNRVAKAAGEANGTAAA